MKPIGRIETFYARSSAAGVRLSAMLRVGDEVYIRGRTTDLRQRIDSLQVNHVPVREASAGMLAGITVVARCRKHDVVYRLSD